MSGTTRPKGANLPRSMNTLTPYVARYLRQRRVEGAITHTTARNHSYELRRFADTYGRRPLAQLGPKAIERWFLTTTRLAPGTRRARLSIVRAFCRWLYEEGIVDDDPTRRAPHVRQPRSVPRAMRASDVARLLADVPDQRARVICWLMVGMGLRCCEVEAASVADYDPRAATLLVHGKGGHERVLPVPVEVAVELDRYLAQVGAVSGPLIRSHRHPSRGLDAGTISNYMSRWMAEAGVKHRPRDGVSAHALRHTAASDVLDECGDLRVVQSMLGHAQLATTSIYLRRANLGQMRSAMEGRTYSASSS